MYMKAFNFKHSMCKSMLELKERDVFKDLASNLPSKNIKHSPPL